MQQSDNQAKFLSKRELGRTAIKATPVITHARIALAEVTRTSIEDRLRRAIAPFGPRISRGTIRLEDVNGPRGGMGLLCTIEVVLDGGDRIRIEQRATAVLEAVRRVIPRVARSVRQHVERSGRKTPRPTGQPRAAELATLRDEQPRATQANGTQSNSKRSQGSNSKRVGPPRDGSQDDSGMTYALEDSQGKPSRKSTRASSNHVKAATQLTRRMRRKLQSPQERAARSAA